jgi:hypothetical protein
MTFSSSTRGYRSVLRAIPALSCLLLVFAGCGKSSSQDEGDGSAGEGDDSSTLGGSGGSGAGGTQSGTAGDKGGSGADRGGTGGVDSVGGAGGRGTGGTELGGATGSGGAAGAAGAAGMAGASGAGAGGAGDETCVNISGGGTEPWHDLTIVGTEFDADEGERMRIVVATQAGNRVGIADVPIVDGAFTVSMPRVLNDGYYVGVTLYVDRNHDDTCATEEQAWDFATRSAVTDMRFDMKPNELCESVSMTCRPRSSTQAPCWVGTGETNLMEPLPCDP